jgi:hypothetical protein
MSLPDERWPLLSLLSIPELDALIEKARELRDRKVFEDRRRVRALVIAAAHAEGFALSELFDLQSSAHG